MKMSSDYYSIVSSKHLKFLTSVEMCTLFVREGYLDIVTKWYPVLAPARGREPQQQQACAVACRSAFIGAEGRTRAEQDRQTPRTCVGWYPKEGGGARELSYLMTL